MPEPPCPMQIFFSGARKEEFSLPVLVFRQILPFGCYGPKTNVPFLRKRSFVTSFFVLCLLQYIYRRQKLNNKYFPENFFKKILYSVLIFFMLKKDRSLRSDLFLFAFSVAFLESLISEEKELPVAAG